MASYEQTIRMYVRAIIKRVITVSQALLRLKNNNLAYVTWEAKCLVINMFRTIKPNHLTLWMDVKSCIFIGKA